MLTKIGRKRSADVGLNVAVSRDQRRELKQLAAQQETTIRALARAALRELLDRERAAR
jgi:hypothetical protein